MTREPSFVLASGGSAVIADGVHTAFPRVSEARAALASHSAPIILGGLAVDLS
jgi:isochorismate synthase